MKLLGFDVEKYLSVSFVLAKVALCLALFLVNEMGLIRPPS